MTLLPVPIVDYRIIEPEFMPSPELEKALADLGAKGFEVVVFVPRSWEGAAKLILARRVGMRAPGEMNGDGYHPKGEHP